MRQSPKHPELTIYKDGRIYDTEQGKWLNINTNHSSSQKGPVAFWTTNGKTYTLQVARLLYEAYISEHELRKEYTIDFKDGDDNNIKLENLKRTKRWEKEAPTMRTYGHDSWLGGDDIYIL